MPLCTLVKHVIVHCLAAFATMDKPQQLKTDNGPAYTSASFQQFYEAIRYITPGIPFNPQR
jgi:hypothetical protein